MKNLNELTYNKKTSEETKEYMKSPPVLVPSQQDKHFKLYVLTNSQTLESALMHAQRERKQDTSACLPWSINEVRHQKFPTPIGSSLISWALLYVVIRHQADGFVEADGFIFTTRYTADRSSVYQLDDRGQADNMHSYRSLWGLLL